MNTRLIMGVLNVTPDSFSDGGLYFSPEKAISRGIEMINEGANVIDVGGESSRPGAEPVDEKEELTRVLPVIEALSDLGGARISIDTVKANVAKEAIKSGASILNDISSNLGEIAAESGVAWITMHMRGTPQTMQKEPYYENVVQEVLEFLLKSAESAARRGVGEIWIDPGIGFGKRLSDNIELLSGLERFVDTSYPVMIGTSRKSFLGVLGAHESSRPVRVEDRLPGSLASAMWALALGAKMVRVHDVKETVQAVKVLSVMEESLVDV